MRVTPRPSALLWDCVGCVPKVFIEGDADGGGEGAGARAAAQLDGPEGVGQRGHRVPDGAGGWAPAPPCAYVPLFIVRGVVYLLFSSLSCQIRLCK
jgi:hypothetical protein